MSITKPRKREENIRTKIQKSDILNKTRFIGDEQDVMNFIVHLLFYEQLGFTFSADPKVAIKQLEFAEESVYKVYYTDLVSDFNGEGLYVFIHKVIPVSENAKYFTFNDIYDQFGKNLKEFYYLIQCLEDKGILIFGDNSFFDYYTEDEDSEIGKLMNENQYFKFRARINDNNPYSSYRINKIKKFKNPKLKKIIKLINQLPNLEHFTLPDELFENGQISVKDTFAMSFNGHKFSNQYDHYMSNNEDFVIYSTISIGGLTSYHYNPEKSSIEKIENELKNDLFLEVLLQPNIDYLESQAYKFMKIYQQIYKCLIS